MSERRDFLRVPESRLVTEIERDNPGAASIVNLSGTGMYTVKPRAKRNYGPRLIQVEIPMPEASESIWALGEVMFDRVSEETVGSGVRFLNMADRDWHLISDLVEHRRREIMAQMMREIKWRKDLAAHPSPFTAPAPPVRENTVKMFLLKDEVEF